MNVYSYIKLPLTITDKNGAGSKSGHCDEARFICLSQDKGGPVPMIIFTNNLMIDLVLGQSSHEVLSIIL